MANIKPLEQLTGWIEYPLETELLDPPILRVRLRYLDGLSMSVDSDPRRPGFHHGEFAAQNASYAVADWDLTHNGKGIEVTVENKQKYLRPLLAESVKGRTRETEVNGEIKKRPVLLGIAILEDAQDRKLFLKN